VSLDFVRGFDAAARHLSFTRAAAELSLTQPAISRQVKALEERLGVALFERHHRRLTLTAAGSEFHHAVRAALETLDGAAARLRPPDDRNVLTITASLSFAGLWLVPRLQGFRARHPGIDIRILADDRVLDPRAHGVDLAVRFCDPEADPAGARPLFRETVMPVCSPALLERDPLSDPRGLSRHVLLQLETPVAGLPWLDWNQWLRAMGVPALRPAGMLRFSSYAQIVQAACDGAGIALGRLPFVRPQLESGQLVALMGRHASPTRHYVLLRAVRRHNAASVDAFETWLLEEASRQDPDAGAGTDALDGSTNPQPAGRTP
jgi:DNA-binding transcriptional LysR family regulator